MLECFVIDHARPSWAVNRWITALLRLFRPQIVKLLESRDAEIARWREKRPGTDVYEDRELEVVSEHWVSIEDQIARIELALAKARRRENAEARQSV